MASFGSMAKRIVTVILMLVCSATLVAQESSRGKIKGLVVFEYNDKEGLAMVTEKDTITVLFKVVFSKPLNKPFPPKGLYQVSYTPNVARFDDVNRSVSYTFVVGNPSVYKSAKKQFHVYQVKSLEKINPIAYPWVEMELYPAKQ